MSHPELTREEGGGAGKSGLSGKSPAALRTIGEVAAELDIPPHVLRFWESRFEQVRPLKRGGGRRFYRPEDVAVVRRIKELLYAQGYTIKGAGKALRASDSGVSAVSGREESAEKLAALMSKIRLKIPEASARERRGELEILLAELKSLKELLAPAA